MDKNPFKELESRLINIENLILDIKHLPLNPQMIDPSEKLLSVEEAANFLKVKKGTIYSKVSKGIIPFMKRGKYLYFTNNDLFNYIKEGKVKSKAEIEAAADRYLSSTKKGLNDGK